MLFELLTLSGVKFSGQVDEVALTLSGGDAVILPKHEPLTALSLPGAVSVRTKSKEELFVTHGGVLEVTGSYVRLLADEADRADDLIEEEIQDAINNAKSIQAGTKDSLELNRAQEIIDRQIVRLNVANIRRRSKPKKDN